jgi:hypothetical protein
MRWTAFFVCFVPTVALAQSSIPPGPVPNLDERSLSELLGSVQPGFDRCIASSSVTSATITATVSPARGDFGTISTANVALVVRAAPRSAAIETCIETAARDSILSAPFTISSGGARATRSLRAGERYVPAPPPPPEFSPSDVTSALTARSASMSACMARAGAPDGQRATLHVVARTNGTVALRSLALPAGSPSGARRCVQSEVTAIRLRAHPRHPTPIAFAIAVRSR